MGIGLPEAAAVAAIGLLVILPFWRIFGKAGYPGWFSVVMLVPLLNIAALFALAFVEWPVSRALTAARKTTGAAG